LSSDRLTLDPIDESDVAFVRTLYADPKVTEKLSRIQKPLTLDEARAFCVTPPADSVERRFIARLGGRPVGVGTIGIPIERSPAVTIGYSLALPMWGQGLGKELAALLVDLAFGRFEAAEVRATTRDDNVASMRVLEKIGFVVLESVKEIDSRGEEQPVTRWVLPRASATNRP
jgi:RimJ/RimL family protein N-acetyltransferase